jgi:hypothetical protein
MVVVVDSLTHNPNNPGVDLRTKGVQTYTKGMEINVITGMALLS